MYYDLEMSGKRIRGLREAKGYTQEILAEEIGMSQKTIAAIEKGKKGTTIDTLVAIAEVLESSLDYIVGGKTTSTELENLLSGLSFDKKEMAFKILKGILENI
jgi:Predicted transcriptional regulators